MTLTVEELQEKIKQVTEDIERELKHKLNHAITDIRKINDFLDSNTSD